MHGGGAGGMGTEWAGDEEQNGQGVRVCEFLIRKLPTVAPLKHSYVCPNHKNLSGPVLVP